MAKLTLADVVTFISDVAAKLTISQNNDLVEAALENTLSRDGTSPNAMSANLDMNSFRILNHPNPVADSDVATKGSIAAQVTAAELAETNAETAETNAAASAAAAASDAAAAAADEVNTDADATATAADVVSTNADVVSTNADVVSTNADVVTAAASAADAVVQAAGFRFDFDSSTSMADPGTGDIRLNNATLASVTAIAIDALSADAGNPDVSAFTSVWGASTTTANRAQLVIRKIGAPASFWVGKITAAVTDNTGWLQLTVTHIVSNGSFSNTDNLIVHHALTGDTGAAGAGSGDLLAANNLSDVDTAATAATNLGVGTGDSPTFTGLVLSADLVTTSTVDSRDIATDGTKLDGVSSGAEVNPAPISQADAEAGTATAEETFTAQRVAQAIAALVLVPLVIAVGDETTAITTGTAKVTFRMPFAMTLTAVKASLTTTSSSGNPTVDINEAGATILTTKLSIDASETTSATAATAVVIGGAGPALAADAEMTIDIDIAGTGAKGLKVTLIGTVD